MNKLLWDKLKSPYNPFLNHEFITSLTESGCIGADKGQLPHYFYHEKNMGILYSFNKGHSYGEYIFDWAWADAHEKHGITYYPKLTSMVPFTPVTTSHFIMPHFDEDVANELLEQYENFYLQHNFSSSHFLFLPPEEIAFFRKHNYIIRESLQYHFFNEDYEDFDAFLLTLQGRKAKNIRKERQHQNLKITQYTKDELNEDQAQRMYHFYISTIENKNSFEYLNEKFFKMIFHTMKNNILYVEASYEDRSVAGSLFFYDEKTLYGRYWGSHIQIENLHFELCYYQGIDFCLKNKLKLFEAGAQGEHKIARGFRPTRIYSAHKLKHQGFHSAVAQFILREKEEIGMLIEELYRKLPFKSEYLSDQHHGP